LRKNLERIGPNSLVGRAVLAARGAAHVERVVVSTDDEEIARAAIRDGSEVVIRPSQISDSKSGSEEALLHVLDTLRESERYEPELLVFLQCTSPFTKPEDIDGVVETLFAEGADCALSVATSHRFLWRQDPTGGAVGINHDKLHRPMRQDMEPQFVETGAVYAMRVAGFRKARHRFFGKIAMHQVPEERAFEIDSPRDLEIARAIASLSQSVGHSILLPAVKAVALDFDGVVTDDCVWVGDDGRESVRCHRGDGLGIERLRAAGVPIVVISKERNPVVQARCRKLQVECKQGVDDKLPALQAWLAEINVDAAAAAYVGNDINDIECLEAVGVGVAVRDAHPLAKRAALLVLERRGGDGAIREFADLLLRDQDRSNDE
jgi:N-acylneuraminate cytidylyltransferase